jgi:hypothetical protein
LTHNLTLDISACAEEAALARENGEDCVGVVIKISDGGDGLFDELAPEGVQGFGSIELGVLLAMVGMTELD